VESDLVRATFLDRLELKAVQQSNFVILSKRQTVPAHFETTCYERTVRSNTSRTVGTSTSQTVHSSKQTRACQKKTKRTRRQIPTSREKELDRTIYAHRRYDNIVLWRKGTGRLAPTVFDQTLEIHLVTEKEETKRVGHRQEDNYI